MTLSIDRITDVHVHVMFACDLQTSVLHIGVAHRLWRCVGDPGVRTVRGGSVFHHPPSHGPQLGVGGQAAKIDFLFLCASYSVTSLLCTPRAHVRPPMPLSPPGTPYSHHITMLFTPFFFQIVHAYGIYMRRRCSDLQLLAPAALLALVALGVPLARLEHHHGLAARLAARRVGVPVDLDALAGLEQT